MTKADIICMIKEAGFEVDENHDVWITDGYWLRELERFAAIIAAAEREACAKLCEELGYYAKHGGWGCADAIRARREQ